ncbi:MAG: bifunctional 4-hydroxy-2-oxoglutarate aldolase/2-dehydro-3-deoxy-phosphogluconate aldolase [Odoribacteraceae bacterium]|jgi:2-dehydro-3-deoxyphosphogluconate aldolase/(4S)-4-hydroxy-2-oxoglutarate aldolase|nr:bifunctional 4-hydroxy-2-oxoglutarate aldolase/2-dehydro-3-deoxy-phosphogluconate aldolase [Odoribacteraceae bacterium]
MARFKRTDIWRTLAETGMIPLFYHPDPATARAALQACYRGGARAFEFTNRGEHAHEVFADLQKWAAVNCPDMALGIGSIVDPATASLYLQLGAAFIVGPCLNPDIFKTCNRRQAAYIPGCGTITEIGAAQELGAEIVKIFPAGNIGGPSFVKNILAPMPWTRLMATGGVDTSPENLTAWFNAGVACVGLGSNLFTPATIAAGDWDAITRQCQTVLQTIKPLLK